MDDQVPRQNLSTVDNVHRGWRIALIATSIVALAWLAGTAMFILDAENTRYIDPVEGFAIEHNCLTGYLAASHLAEADAENIYDQSQYRGAKDVTPIHQAVEGVFTVDGYQYPPSFLIMPYLMQKLFGDFFSVRIAWFVLTLALFVGGFIVVALWCGAFRKRPELLIFPLLLCAPTVHLALQMGNIHLIVIAASMLGMVAFEKERPIIGGALLGFAVVTKLWPGVLIIYLLLQKRWKPAVACSAAVAVYSLGVLLIFGPEPFESFISYQLPRIASGEAFGFMAVIPRPIQGNISIFGISHKLHALGLLASQPALLSSTLKWISTPLIVGIVIVIGLRRGDDSAASDTGRLARAQLWLALLTLVQLRSPFLPWPYGVVSTLWLLLLLSASARGWLRGVILVAWLFLSVNVPVNILSGSAAFHLSYTLIGTVLIFGSVVIGLREYWRHNRDWLWLKTR